MAAAIQVEGLWKTYKVRPLGRGLKRGCKESREFHALRDVSFQLDQGGVLGVIGANGAGKSTLLKVLSRITDPSAGRAVIRGSVASLLEVGTGFHPELTGRENVFLNAALHGLGRKAVRERLDAILEFAGVGEFIDIPVKRFSSGMYLRLAFSVAAHLEPDILIVDELLAVGDAAFRAKCFERMDKAARGGRTVLLVSHDSAAVRSLCTSAIRLDQGKLVDQGPTAEVVGRFLQAVRAGGGEITTNTGAVRCDAVQARVEAGAHGLRAHVELDLTALRDVQDLAIDFALRGPDGTRLLQSLPTAGAGPTATARSGEHLAYRLRVDLPPLPPGAYSGVFHVQELNRDPVLQMAHVPLFELGPDPAHPQTIAPGFSAVLLPVHDVSLEVLSP